MSPEIPREWFDLAELDVRYARAGLEQNLGLQGAAVHLHEAVEKVLKGFLITAGWDLSKTHALRFLLKEAGKRDARFAAYASLCERIDDYLLLRYPPFPQVSATSEELSADLAEVETLIGLARQAVKETLG